MRAVGPRNGLTIDDVGRSIKTEIGTRQPLTSVVRAQAQLEDWKMGGVLMPDIAHSV
jgi:hypothetical protein